MTYSIIPKFGRRVRLGMVGGGKDSVIGRTHLVAMRADGLCELVARAMSIARDRPGFGQGRADRRRPHLYGLSGHGRS